MHRPRNGHLLVVLSCIAVTAGATIVSAADRLPKGWPMFRGDAACSGVAADPLPGRLTLRWKFEAGEPFMSSAAIVEGSVYVGCDDEHLYAIELSGGKVKWKYRTRSFVQSSPSVAGDLVVIGDDDGMLHAVDRRTGLRKWTYASGAQIISSPNVHGGRVIFGSYDAFVYCLDLDSGELLWRFETAGPVHGTPGITEGRALAAGCDEFLHVLRIADGALERQVSMESVSGTSAALAGAEVFLGTYGNQVRCINWKTGVTKWIFEPEDRKFPFLSSAAVTSRAVILGGRDKRLWALDRKTGKVLWRHGAKGRIDSSPVVVGQRVFVGSSDGNLYGLDLRTGHELERFELGAPITASPAVGRGCLVIGNQDGVLYCFESGGTPLSNKIRTDKLSPQGP